MTFHYVRQAQVPTEEAAPRTVRERSQSLETVRMTVSAGDSTAQLGHEVQRKQEADRERLVEAIRKAGDKFRVVVPVQFSLAMKADLNIPWNKLRNIKRSVGGAYIVVWSAM